MMHSLLFDLDGTLADTVPLWLEANVEMLRSIGVEMTEQTFLTDYYHAGLHFRGILEKCGRPTEKAERYYHDRDLLYEAMLRSRVEWLPGAEAMLMQVSQRYPLGMLTGSIRDFITALDERLHLSRYFQSVVTYDDTQERKKPDPFGLFLLTQQMKVDPKECLYIGDQMVDIEAAHAAGMPCCLLAGSATTTAAEKEADFVIRNIGEVAAVIDGNV